MTKIQGKYLHFVPFNIQLIILIPFFVHRDKTKKKSVVFADGILPGHGTSASDDTSESDSDEMSTKKLIARSRNKKKMARMNAAESMVNNQSIHSIDKENIDEKIVSKVNLKHLFSLYYN